MPKRKQTRPDGLPVGFTGYQAKRLKEISLSLGQVYDEWWIRDGHDFDEYYPHLKIKEHIFISGGCLASLWHGENIHDYDFFVSGYDHANVPRDHYINALTLFYQNKGIQQFSSPEYMDFINGGITKNNSINLPYGNIQIITMWSESCRSIQDIIKTFDYKHPGWWWEPVNRKLWIDPIVLGLNINKLLVINNSDHFHTDREEKFIDRGWTPGPTDYFGHKSDRIKRLLNR
tara:strand:+ start:9640 stop:10332 length:693 start_codon:yes stop_codon:yes gene_type:complete